jgi:hypothetical protein
VVTAGKNRDPCWAAVIGLSAMRQGRCEPTGRRADDVCSNGIVDSGTAGAGRRRLLDEHNARSVPNVVGKSWHREPIWHVRGEVTSCPVAE